jgi:hypothetical protein
LHVYLLQLLVDLLVLKFSHRVLCKLCPVVVAILNLLGMTAIATPRLHICQVSHTGSREPLVIIS